MLNGFPANPARIPVSPHRRSQAAPGLTRSALQEEGAGHRGPRGLLVQRSKATSAITARTPVSGVLGRPRGGAKLGESHPATPVLPTPPRVGPGQAIMGPFSEPPWLGRGIWDLGPPARSCDRICTVASHRPGTGNLDRFVLFRADLSPFFASFGREPDS
uniref:Uncharacterized protein n=1 Tax=Molossus molossus TaxID=27622 RepID=A0A7J8DQB4_MOLMO|nr:hypothetical protein HJG59_009237 [Molossus molossus]